MLTLTAVRRSGRTSRTRKRPRTTSRASEYSFWHSCSLGGPSPSSFCEPDLLDGSSEHLIDFRARRSFLANLANVSAFVPFLADWQRASNGTFSAVSGILPPAVAALFAMLLPLVIRAISRFRGSTTTTELDRLVCSRLFDFTFASQLIVFSCITIIFNLGVGMLAQLGQGTNISQLFHMLDDLPVSVSSTYQQEWIYWTTWLPSRGFAGEFGEASLRRGSTLMPLAPPTAVFDLAQLINLVVVQSKSFLLGRRRTPREAREWMKPKRFKFEVRRPWPRLRGALTLGLYTDLHEQPAFPRVCGTRLCRPGARCCRCGVRGAWHLDSRVPLPAHVVRLGAALPACDPC